MTAKVIELRPAAPAAREQDALREGLKVFDGTPLESRMAAYADKQAALIAVLRPLVAGKKHPDPVTAPSLAPLRALKRKGQTLAEVLQGMLSEHHVSWSAWPKPWGLTSMDFPSLSLGLDLTDESKAAKTLEKAWGPGWRTVVANDCHSLDIKIFEEAGSVLKAEARFYRKVTRK